MVGRGGEVAYIHCADWNVRIEKIKVIPIDKISYLLNRKIIKVINWGNPKYIDYTKKVGRKMLCTVWNGLFCLCLYKTY